MKLPGWSQHALRIATLLVLCVAALQLVFVARIALMRWVDPQSTSFQRSEVWRLLVEKHQVAWAQDWVDHARLSDNLQRAVIASEDAGFVDHGGVEWDAVEKAWNKNQRAEQRARRYPPKVVGGSTITQQLAKNLFLSGERTVLRKAQELVLTLLLEGLLD